MAEDRSTPEVFYEGWKEYMDTVSAALEPLAAEQLGLQAAATERTVGEMAQHIVAARVLWFHDFMGEGGDEIARYSTWDGPGAPVLGSSDIVRGLNATWQFMWERMTRWTPEDMQRTFPHEWRGEHYDLSRSWVVWHILEHDLIHGGEISLTLGMHGLAAPRP
ncbi:MAG TPA: DinB family protein [Chloroflexia bacterium]|nr:DinB family protein [Chloroflexia bacterium]